MPHSNWGIWKSFTEEIFELSKGKVTLCRGNCVCKNSEGGESILCSVNYKFSLIWKAESVCVSESGEGEGMMESRVKS